MGFLSTTWTAEHEGRTFTVVRNEVRKGIEVRCEGTKVAEKRWSLIGVGEVKGEVELDGARVPVIAKVTLGGTCRLTIGGTTIVARKL